MPEVVIVCSDSPLTRKSRERVFEESSRLLSLETEEGDAVALKAVTNNARTLWAHQLHTAITKAALPRPVPLPRLAKDATWRRTRT